MVRTGAVNWASIQVGENFLQRKERKKETKGKTRRRALAPLYAGVLCIGGGGAVLSRVDSGSDMARPAVWPYVKACIIGGVFGRTFADWCASVFTVDGSSMYPTLDDQHAEWALMEKRCLYRHDFSRGDVVVFRSPRNHREFLVKRLIALPGDWIQIPENQEIRQIPQGHFWAEGDNAAISLDSRFFGPVPLGLMQGRVTHVVWPPHRFGRVDRKMPEGRIMPL